MHEADHERSHEDSSSGLADLAQVVVSMGGGDQLAWFLRLEMRSG